MCVDRDSGRGQPALPASRDAADRKVDILDVEEDRRIKAADIEKGSAIECSGPATRGERVEEVARQNLHRLAVQVVEPVQGAVDDDAGRIDVPFVAATNENWHRHYDSLVGIEYLDESFQEGRRTHDVVVEQNHGR